MPEKKPANLDSDMAAVPLHSDSTVDQTEGADPQTEAPRQSPFSQEELQYFHDLLVEKRSAAVEDIERMRAQLEDAREQAENDTAYSFHMADAGTDAMEREKLYLMVARQQKYVGYLDRALERVRNKTYGVCKVTGKPISKERLEAVPHTEISIEAKLKQKK
jgi:DnaK suppressor protein